MWQHGAEQQPSASPTYLTKRLRLRLRLRLQLGLGNIRGLP
eukprot:COSAG01_NODE_20235_length_964_cov_1.375723_1_plen_40_part_10